MTTQATTQRSQAHGKRRSAALLRLGEALAGVVALGGVTRQADAVFTEKVVFASDRTAGTGVNNPTGDFEIFRMNPDGTRIFYESSGVQDSNLQGDKEIYRLNTLDGQRNLTDNDALDFVYPD